MTLKPIFEKLYPAGSYGGQCFTFLHELVDFPHVGTLLATKKASLLKYGIPVAKLDEFKVGDIIFTNESATYGHGAIIHTKEGFKGFLTESNYKSLSRPFKVYHDRVIDLRSTKILGVFRGKAKYKLPEVQYPIQIPVKVLLNNADLNFDNRQFLYEKWNTILQHMANLQRWFWDESGQRIQLIIDYKITNIKNWETVFTGPSIGGHNVEIIKESWFDQNIMPQADGAEIVIFNMERKDWKGKVFDHPDLIELGYCYEKANMPFPVKIMTVCDQYDDYAPYYPTLGAYAKLMAHEICHGLYGLAVNSETPCNGRAYALPPGTDLTHTWFYGQSPDPKRVFEDLNYQLLNQKLNYK